MNKVTKKENKSNNKKNKNKNKKVKEIGGPVSYTHLTLPTNREV